MQGAGANTVTLVEEAWRSCSGRGSVSNERLAVAGVFLLLYSYLGVLQDPEGDEVSPQRALKREANVADGSSGVVMGCRSCIPTDETYRVTLLTLLFLARAGPGQATRVQAASQAHLPPSNTSI